MAILNLHTKWERLQPDDKPADKLPNEAKTKDDPYDISFSEWVAFFSSQRKDHTQTIAPEPLSEATNVDLIEREGLKKWIGQIASRSDKVVLVGNPIVARTIEAVFKETKKQPVLLPCFLTPRISAWIAKAVDFVSLEQEKLIDQGEFRRMQIRLTHLESRFVQMENALSRLEKIQTCSDMVVIIDYQNFKDSCDLLGIWIHLEQLVDYIAKYRVETPRHVRRAIVVDFDLPEHGWIKESNEDDKLFELYPVPRSDLGNPTDQYVYRAAIEAIEKFQLKRGSAIALISSDHHFIPLIIDLNKNGFETILVGDYPESIAEGMIGVPKHYINLIMPSQLFKREEVREA